MRIRIIEFDVTPEEVSRTPELRDLLRREAFASVAVGDVTERDGSGQAPALPAPIAGVLAARGPGGVALQTLHEFLAEVLTWEGVDPRVGVSRLNQLPANVIRLHRRGSGVGAFVYVELPAVSLKFRLPRNHRLQGLTHARARDVKPDAPYGIAMRLTAAGLGDALKLTRRAYEHTEGAPPATAPPPAAPARARAAARGRSGGGRRGPAA